MTTCHLVLQCLWQDVSMFNAKRPLTQTLTFSQPSTTDFQTSLATVLYNSLAWFTHVSMRMEKDIKGILILGVVMNFKVKSRVWGSGILFSVVVMFVADWQLGLRPVCVCFLGTELLHSVTEYIKELYTLTFPSDMTSRSSYLFI